MHRTKLLSMAVAAACLAALLSAPLHAQQPPPAEGDEAQLVAVLQSSDARLFDKAKACQQFAVIGTKKAVPVLAGLLDDEQLSHYARFGLEPIADPAVDEALREAAGKLRGGLLVGVINSIGVRRDGEAVDLLKELLGAPELATAKAAAAALGRIATPEAIDLLRGALADAAELRPAVADACLTAADTLMGQGNNAQAAALFQALEKADLPEHLHMAALDGVLRARGTDALPRLVECLASDDAARFRVGLRAAQQIPGDGVTRALVAELAKPLPEGEAPAEILAITKAEYGAEDAWIDVTDEVAAAVSGNGISITAGNHLAGDPVNGVPKTLRFEYTLDGEPHTAEIAEKEAFEIEASGTQHPRQALLVYALGERGDKDASPVVLEMAEQGPWDLRVAAVRALAKLGDAEAVPSLLRIAVDPQGELSSAARDSLAELPGDGVDSALAEALAASGSERLPVVIDLVGRRGIASAVPSLVKLAESDDRSLRTAAIEALGLTVGLDRLPVLVDRLVDPPTPDVAAAAKEALRKACMRMPDRDAAAALLIERLETARGDAKADLLDLLGVLGGPKALDGVSKAAAEGDEPMQDAATRVLGEWMSADAAPVLLGLAKTGNDQFKIRCLRGYIRIARQLDVPDGERMAMCREALKAAERNEEKALVLEVLGRYPSAEALALAIPYVDNAALKEAACQSSVKIAQDILDAQPAAVADAMQRVMRAAADPELAKRARGLNNRAERKLGKK